MFAGRIILQYLPDLVIFVTPCIEAETKPFHDRKSFHDEILEHKKKYSVEKLQVPWLK